VGYIRAKAKSIKVGGTKHFKSSEKDNEKLYLLFAEIVYGISMYIRDSNFDFLNFEK